MELKEWENKIKTFEAAHRNFALEALNNYHYLNDKTKEDMLDFLKEWLINYIAAEKPDISSTSIIPILQDFYAVYDTKQTTFSTKVSIKDLGLYKEFLASQNGTQAESMNILIESLNKTNEVLNPLRSDKLKDLLAEILDVFVSSENDYKKASSNATDKITNQLNEEKQKIEELKIEKNTIEVNALKEKEQTKEEIEQLKKAVEEKTKQNLELSGKIQTMDLLEQNLREKIKEVEDLNLKMTVKNKELVTFIKKYTSEKAKYDILKPEFEALKLKNEINEKKIKVYEQELNNPSRLENKIRKTPSRRRNNRKNSSFTK